MTKTVVFVTDGKTVGFIRNRPLVYGKLRLTRSLSAAAYVSELKAQLIVEHLQRHLDASVLVDTASIEMSL